MKKNDRTIQRVMMKKAEGLNLDEFYAVGFDEKMYKWDWSTGEWRPFWKPSLEKIASTS